MSDALADPLARAVAHYLLQHPMACDSPRGIAQWWLAAPVRTGDLERALEALCDDGVLARRDTGAPRSPRYQLAIDPVRLAALLQSHGGLPLN